MVEETLAMDVKTRIYVVDLLLSTFFFTPLVVLFWHGNFGILDFLLLKQYPLFGPWFILVLGIVVQVLFCGFQCEIKSMVASKTEKRLCLVLYNYIMATAQILQFRGLNDIYEYTMGLAVYDAITATCTAVVILFGTGLMSQVTDMPLTLTLDTELTTDNGFHLDTYYNTEKGANMHHFLDAIGTYAVMQTFVHIFSIAAWVAVDQGFFPWSPFLAMMSSWVLGHSLLLSLGYYMPHLQRLSWDALHTDVPYVGTVFLNMLIMAQGLGVIMSWHGHWVLYDVVKNYLPIYHIGYNVTPFYEVLASFTLLALCGVSSVLVRKGITSDISAECVDNLREQVNYFAHYYRDHIDKMEAAGGGNSNGENNNKSDGEGDEGDAIVSEAVKAIARKSVGPKATIQKKDVSLQHLVDIDRKKRELKKTK